MSTGSISVGQLVRVALIRGPGAEEGVMCRAIVACCNEDDTYDVIYNSNSYEQTEEGSVPRARVSALEDFEAGAEYGPAAAAVDSPVEEPTALELKERGNRLFQLKDYDAAREQYVCAQRSVAPQPPPTVGSRVVVLDKLGEYLPGTVCNAEGNSVVDVIYDMEGADGTDEEDRVSLSRVILLAIDGAPQQLQGILFMNLAKVSLKLRRNGWAIRYAACAIGIMGVDHAAAAEQAKKLIDAYYFRAKVLLLVNRPGRALAV